jgi:DMSO/TMAO reductase YedYZ molybdopterin-dependent catalytic subunit
MNKLSRRKLLAAGLGTTAGASALALAAKNGFIPPDHQGIYGIGETLNYASHHALMSLGSSAREFAPSQISPNPNPNGSPPRDETFEKLRAENFAGWRLTVDGLVARPTTFSLRELKALPASAQITQLACEEGWSFIAQWTGVALSHLLELTGARPQARFVAYFSHQSDWWDSIDWSEAVHPQTLLAYWMNGEDLPVNHGAPARLRVPRQLGYKSVKHLTRITVTDSLDKIGDGRGSSAPSAGFAWYAGI